MNKTPLLALLAPLALLGCGGGNNDFTAVTYNAGLAVGFVDGAESRTPLVADALAELDADVVCLQEIFLPEQVAAIEAATTQAFPHTFFPDPLPPEPSDAIACDPDTGTIDSMLTCLEDSCADVCVDELEECLFDNCALAFLSLPKSCQGCVMAQVGQEPATARDVCESEPTAYAYGHSFGTGILSRHPISQTDHQVFASSVNRRGSIHATVDAPNGPVEVVCTHLTPDFSLLPYPKSEGSWAEEQADQIVAVRAQIDALSGGPVVVMGDFNTGPALEGIEPEVPENYDALAEGLQNPYADQIGECTYCGSNPLIGTDDSRLIDHILLRDTGGATAARLFEASAEAESCGESFTAPLSDHYGVQVTFSLEAE